MSIRRRAEEPLEVSKRRASNLFRARSPQRGHFASHLHDERRLVALPPVRNGGEVRSVRLDQESVIRYRACGRPDGVRILEGQDSREADVEAEIEESSWLLSDVDEDLLFNIPADQMWEQAIRRMGADPSALHSSRGVH